MTRKRPDVQPCGERHASYLHCATCWPIPPERPDKLQGPEIGAEVTYTSKSFPDGVPAVVMQRSYVWAPNDPAYRGGSRRYDWKVIRILGDLPPFFGSRGLCVDDKDLTAASA